MTREEFFELPNDKRCDLVASSLVNLILLELLVPHISRNIKGENYEVIKIVLGAYMNGVIK